MGTKSQKKGPQPSKMAKATEVYERMVKDPGAQRKDIIAEFVQSCGLTSAGAATYYGIIKKRGEKRNEGV